MVPNGNSEMTIIRLSNHNNFLVCQSIQEIEEMTVLKGKTEMSMKESLRYCDLTQKGRR